jgi:hypothetical protein
MKTYFDKFVPGFVKPSARNGYYPQQLLVNYFLPCIWKFVNSFENKSIDKESGRGNNSNNIFFHNILSELHVDSINLKQVEYVIADEITGESSYLDDINYRNIVYSLYQGMLKDIREEYSVQPFVAAVLEVFPNKDKTGGHAITLLKCKCEDLPPNVSCKCPGGIPCCPDDSECYYIIDDQNSISTLSDYYTRRSARLFEIVIRDIDPVNIANINRILRAKCNSDTSFSNRVTRYVLNFEHKFLSGADMIAEQASSIIESTREEVLNKIDEQFQKIVGGNDEDKNSGFFSWMSDKWVVFIFGILTGILLMCLVIRRVASKYDGDGKTREGFVSRIVRKYIVNGYDLTEANLRTKI